MNQLKKSLNYASRIKHLFISPNKLINTVRQPETRYFDIHKYPHKCQNTILNKCPKGKNMIVETYKGHKIIKNSGFFLAWPFFQRIKSVDMTNIKMEFDIKQ